MTAPKFPFSKPAPLPPVAEGVGAVALIDALGFSGIWNRKTPAEVLAALRAAQSHARGQAGLHRIFQNLQILTAAFSDTILLAGLPTEPKAQAPWRPAADLKTLVGALGSVVCSVVRRLAEGEVPLIYRGCLAVGKLAVQGHYFVGEAVDEAAEYAEVADGAFVWLAPSAAEHATVGDTFIEWGVPMKSGGPIRTLVVNPLWDFAVECMGAGQQNPEFDSLESTLLAPFETSKSLDVVRKRQNTAEFLAHAKAQLTRSYAADFDSYQTARYSVEGDDGEDGEDETS